ncbi:hypothetical protein [Antrihabitans cavernicola]|uniref:Ferredoxin n=1 Tax=Antrihabitans cavernicola TaxID=2495913 RepID=A0A5A7SBM0_9NOCA|nr:hypothetical protein [Spelaeibacter cavernicola]KAA0021983.1 hypothetical protein FOY51_16505 [Spelaeibacter cavernicola]
MDASTWAKAPDFTGSPERVEAVRTQTVADKQNYLESGMQPVECRACGTTVLARKNSFNQTSIQWTADPATSCTEYAKDETQPRSLRETCPRLRSSIEHAVMEGILEVRDRD